MLLENSNNYCGVRSSCWLCSMAGIFRLAGCDAGSVVSPRGWFSMGMLRVCPVAVAGGEPLCEVWFPLLRNISDWDGVCECCVAWREYIAGLNVRLMRRYVQV
jgi:hypothetical protein